MIFLKSAREIEVLRRANVIVAEILQELKERIAPGVTTADLDALAEELIDKKNARSAFKGYVMAGRVFPCSLCASINEEIVHGIPSDRALREGDIIGLDFGVIYDGFYGDSAITVGVGKVSEEAQRLMQVTEEALNAGIAQVRSGNRLSDISHAVQEVAESSGFSIVREFVGHGIGTQLHEDPQVPNYGKPGLGPERSQGQDRQW